MIKRILSLLLIAVLCLSFSWAQAETQPFVQLLMAKMSQGECFLTLRSGQAGEVTCLVYAANEKGEQGELLQVSQWDVKTGGVFTKSFLVAPFETGYVVQVGGSHVGVPKKILLKDTYVSPALRMDGEETTQTLTEKATHLQQVEIIRNEKTVTPGDVILPGDQITGLWGEERFAGYAVVAGDVDLDGLVNAKDALQVLRFSVGKTILSQAAMVAADFAQTGKLDAVCALNILKYSVGKLKSL